MKWKWLPNPTCALSPQVACSILAPWRPRSPSQAPVRGQTWCPPFRDLPQWHLALEAPMKVTAVGAGGQLVPSGNRCSGGRAGENRDNCDLPLGSFCSPVLQHFPFHPSHTLPWGRSSQPPAPSAGPGPVGNWSHPGPEYSPVVPLDAHAWADQSHLTGRRLPFGTAVAPPSFSCPCPEQMGRGGDAGKQQQQQGPPQIPAPTVALSPVAAAPPETAYSSRNS